MYSLGCLISSDKKKLETPGLGVVCHRCAPCTYKYTLVISTVWLIDASVSSGLCAPIVELVPKNKHQRLVFFNQGLQVM
jgi:hypothetical protein